MKRTTLVLDEAIYADLKKRAVAEGRTLTEVVEHALRRGLASPGRRPQTDLTLPSYDLGPFLVDPADRTTFGEATERPGQTE